MQRLFLMAMIEYIQWIWLLLIIYIILPNCCLEYFVLCLSRINVGKFSINLLNGTTLMCELWLLLLSFVLFHIPDQHFSALVTCLCYIFEFLIFFLGTFKTKLHCKTKITPKSDTPALIIVHLLYCWTIIYICATSEIIFGIMNDFD